MVFIVYGVTSTSNACVSNHITIPCVVIVIFCTLVVTSIFRAMSKPLPNFLRLKVFSGLFSIGYRLLRIQFSHEIYVYVGQSILLDVLFGFFRIEMPLFQFILYLKQYFYSNIFHLTSPGCFVRVYLTCGSMHPLWMLFLFFCYGGKYRRSVQKVSYSKHWISTYRFVLQLACL